MNRPAPDNASLKRALQLCESAREWRRQGRLQQAVHAFQEASRACPTSVVPYEGLLEMLIEHGELGGAATVLAVTPPALYRQSVALQSLHAGLLLRQEKFAQARELFEKLARLPGIDRARLCFNLGWCDIGLGELRRALDDFRQAREAGMGDTSTWLSQGFVLQSLGDIAGAEALYADALQHFPGNSDLLYEVSMLRLRQGEYARGFALFHHRRGARVADFGKLPALTIPQWDGKTRVGRLLVLSEQGVGDQIAFSALLPALADHADSVQACLDARLDPLLQRSFPGIAPVQDRDRQALSRDHDAYVLAGDIGATTVAGAGWTQGLLQPEPGLAAALQRRYRERFPGKKLVGISWKSPKADTSASKSIALAQWRDILQTPDLQFLSLQYGEVAEDIRLAKEQLGVDIFVDAEIDSLVSLEALAAQVAALDQVITVSNTTAHVAAATGTPTWVLLPAQSGLFWYWGARGDSTPWYPAARLFRAQRDRQWDDVLAAVAQALRGAS